MKTCVLIAGVVMLLATGAAHATDYHDEDKGDEYACGPSYDTVWIKRGGTTHEWEWTITINSANYHARKGERYPIVRYDAQKDALTLNGKRCRERK
jgi:hypothetical protein